MKYRCIPCDFEFDVQNDAKPRCPRCLNIHDLERVEIQKKTSSANAAKWIVPASIVAVVAVLAVVRFATDAKEPASKTDKAGDLASYLAKSELAKKDAVVPFDPTAAIKKFAEQSSKGKTGLKAMQALFDTILSKRQSKHWTPHDQREPRKEKPLTADELLAKLEQPSDKPWEALSYELSCLLLAAARSVNLDVRMAEIIRFDTEKTPADSGGKLGRYAVAFGQSAGQTPAPLFDPYSGRFMESAKATAVVLDDKEATAPYYGLGSLALLVQHDTQAALKLNKIAIELAPQNPYFRTGRALIFGLSGAPQEALAELEKAVNLRDDAVTRTNLAEVQIFADIGGKQAEASIQAALSSMPQYGRAHGILAMIHLMRREFDQAEPELTMADRYDPGSPAISMFWAQYYAVQGLAEEAIDKALEACRLSNESLSTLVGLASIYRQTARFEEMRVTLDKVLAKADSPAMAAELKQLFQYGEKDSDNDTDAASGAADANDQGGLQLKLGNEEGAPGLTGPKLGGDPGRAGPRLGGGLELGEPKPGGDPNSEGGPKLNSGRLRLDFDSKKK